MGNCKTIYRAAVPGFGVCLLSLTLSAGVGGADEVKGDGASPAPVASVGAAAAAANGPEVAVAHFGDNSAANAGGGQGGAVTFRMIKVHSGHDGYISKLFKTTPPPRIEPFIAPAFAPIGGLRNVSPPDGPSRRLGMVVRNREGFKVWSGNVIQWREPDVIQWWEFTDGLRSVRLVSDFDAGGGRAREHAGDRLDGRLSDFERVAARGGAPTFGYGIGRGSFEP